MRSDQSELVVEDLVAGLNLLVSTPGFVRQRITPERARAVVRKRLRHRAERFLELANRAILARPGNPYHALFKHVGCEFGDLEKLVVQEGLEGALDRLRDQGVFLTVDELKGRRPVVRGSAQIEFGLRRLRNLVGAGRLTTGSSGSRGQSTEAVVDLASIRAQAHNVALVLQARGGSALRLAIWGVPGSVALVRVLDFSLVGSQLPLWFPQVDPAHPSLHLRYRWSMRVLRLGYRLAGLRLPRAVNAPLDAPLPVAEWALQELRRGGTPLIWGSVSPVVRLCQRAVEAGLDLSGVRFSVGGEPSTPARLATIRQAGGEVLPHYASTEAGLLAYGCLRPESEDDLHLMDDLHALTRATGAQEAAGLAAGTLLVSSIDPYARFVLVNASLGDRAEVERRACGCLLESEGWGQHLRMVRSFEKVTTGGMTFLDHDIERVLEEALPARFGGGPTDYQLVEEHDESGQPRLRLLVDPTVGVTDLDVVADYFLAALGSGDGAQRVMTTQWQAAGWLQAERRAPHRTSGGKVLHLHRAGPRLAEVSGV